METEEGGMPDTLIENPILNTPYREPTRHFHFGEEGITNEIVETRRPSTYFVPIPPPKKKGKQLVFDTEWTEDRIETSDKVNRIRERVNRFPHDPGNLQDPGRQVPRLARRAR
jgi:type III restriction enzyme